MKMGNSFGAWLYQQRCASDRARKSLAGQVGCAEITLRRIENGTLKPSKALALILLEKLGISRNDPLHWVQFARGPTGYPEQPVGFSPHETADRPALSADHLHWTRCDPFCPSDIFP